MSKQLLITMALLFLIAATGCTVVVSDEPLGFAPPEATRTPLSLPPPRRATPTATATITPQTVAMQVSDTIPIPTDTPTRLPTTVIITTPASLLPTSTLPAAATAVTATPTAPVATPTATLVIIPATPTPQPSPTPVPPTATPTLAVEPVSYSHNPTPQASANQNSPTVQETSLTLNSYDYQSALVATNPDDPVYPYPRLDHNRVGPPAPKNYRAIVLENRYTQLTILPDLGGRIYRWLDKNTGKNLFYENPVIKPTSWGHRGWWLATGGMEWALPVDEHGLNEASPWAYTLYQHPDEASVTLTDTEENSGLISEVNIALNREHAYFTLTPRIINPTGQPISYKFWINGMFDLSAGQPQPETRFVLPVEQVTVHSTGDSALPGEGQPMSWPRFEGRDFSHYSDWKNYLGVFAAPAAQENFMGAYNRATNLGVVRVFPHMLARGAKIFGPADLDPGLWTTDGSSYFELWGGLAPTFWDQVSLEPGAWVTWQERWYAVGDMGGFSYANEEAALNMGVLADSVQVAAASTHPIDGYLVLWNNAEEIHRWPLKLYPESPFRSSFSASSVRGGEWGLSLFEQNGREVAAIGRTQPTLPDHSQPAVIPASFSQPAPTPTATPYLLPPTPTPLPATPTVTPSPTVIRRVPLQWDPRLDDIDVTLTPGREEPGQPIFRLVAAKYLSEWEAAGLHHVFVEVLDEQGERIVGQPVMLSWRDGKSKMVTEDKPYPEFAANSPLYGSLEDGTYKVYVDGAPSDIVSGLGLPGKHHVNYQLTFQRGVETFANPAAPTPGSTAQPTSTPAAATPASGGSGGNTAIGWDPRLDDLGIKLNKAQPKPGQPIFRLVSAKYQDDTQSGGMHHVFVEVLAENGQRILNQPVVMAWADGKTTMITEDKPYPEFAANAPMYGPMDQGTYEVYVDGAVSDRISGLGLPGNHHVNYLLTFQRRNQ